MSRYNSPIGFSRLSDELLGMEHRRQLLQQKQQLLRRSDVQRVEPGWFQPKKTRHQNGRNDEKQPAKPSNCFVFGGFAPNLHPGGNFFMPRFVVFGNRVFFLNNRVATTTNDVKWQGNMGIWPVNWLCQFSAYDDCLSPDTFFFPPVPLSFRDPASNLQSGALRLNCVILIACQPCIW